MTGTTTPRGPASTRYRAELEACRALVSTFIDGRLPELFDKAGVALLEFAARAESDAVQGRLFEAMGLLQQRRHDIEHIFHQELNAGFQNFGSSGPSTRDFEADPKVAGIELSLMEPDELEESIATENLVSKANANYFPELYALSLRLSAMVGGRKLKDSEIPGGPSHLVSSFRRALDGLNVEVKVRIILYAILDKTITSQCRQVYDDCNKTLQAAGILPTLKPVPVRAEMKQTKATEETDAQSEAGNRSAQAVSPDGEQSSPTVDVFETILELMATRRPMKQRSGQKPRFRGEPPPERAAAATRQVLSALSQVQAKTAAEVHSRAAQTPPTSPRGEPPDTAPWAAGPQNAEASGISRRYPNVEIDAGFLDRVRVALTQEREQILEQVNRDDLSPVDADLIDLIGMLFEYMLNDPVLPNAAKALLSHLHTPYLKVALIDRRLLVDSRHPARRLLDDMVEAGSLWVEEGSPSRGIFPIMQRTVDRVLEEFTDDVGLFEELAKDFKQATQEQQRRTDTVEQRTQKAAQGREKLHLAKQRASERLQTLAKVHPIPKALSQFLNSTWLDHLVFIVLREGDAPESTAWREAVSTADALVALFDQTATPGERRARIAQIPQLRKTILREIERMGSYSRSTVEGLWALLDDPKSWRPEDLQSPAESVVRIGKGTTGTGIPDGLPQSDAGPDTSLSAAQKEMIERLRKMRFGTWFEFTPAEGGPSRRIKLSWVSPLTSTCMFVDRAGLQAEIKTLGNLADEILSGRAKVIPRPKHPFIDRALVSIRKMLQSDSGEAAEPNIA